MTTIGAVGHRNSGMGPLRESLNEHWARQADAADEESSPAAVLIRNSRIIVANPTHIAVGIYFRPEVTLMPFISLMETNQRALAVRAYAASVGVGLSALYSLQTTLPHALAVRMPLLFSPGAQAWQARVPDVQCPPVIFHMAVQHARFDQART